ncbi:VanZ family protein [Peribacillus loiseleuriae]|uniref:VanZ family protein n=1 Tax=Peribacillus loiseleuriae TaxID=1679170 RepID=UPI003D011E7A
MSYPFAFILPLLSNRVLNFKTVTFATFSLSFTYEIFQLIFKFGSFDIDDLILNTLAGILGYFPIKLCQLYIKSKRKHLKNNAFVS